MSKHFDKRQSTYTTATNQSNMNVSSAATSMITLTTAIRSIHVPSNIGFLDSIIFNYDNQCIAKNNSDIYLCIQPMMYLASM